MSRCWTPSSVRSRVRFEFLLSRLLNQRPATTEGFEHTAKERSVANTVYQ